MKSNQKTSLMFRAFMLGVGMMLSGARVSSAGTLAYWRFEEGPVDAQVPHAGVPDGVFFPAVADHSGNGNDLSVWAEGWAGYAYRADLQARVITQTGETNELSVQNSGPLPTLFAASPTMMAFTPGAFTIEASFKPEIGFWRTFVGRDSFGATSFDPLLSALYFQATPGDAVAIKFTDVSGVWHEAVSDYGAIRGFVYPDASTGHWYNMAAVSDGSILSLYLDDVEAGLGYRLVARTDMRGTSPNTAMTSGFGSGVDWSAGTWSVGRGMYAGGHTDRAYGLIDEVRISDIPLRPDHFLFSTPWTNPPVVVRINDTPSGKAVVQVDGAPGGWTFARTVTDPESDGGVITLKGVDQYNAVPDQGWRFVVPTAPDATRNAVDIVRIQHDVRAAGGDDSLQIAFASAKRGSFYESPESAGDNNAGIVTDRWVRLYADDFVVVEYKPHSTRLRN